MFCDLGSCVKHCRKILQQDDVHQRAKHEEWSSKALRMLTDIYDTAKRGQSDGSVPRYVLPKQQHIPNVLVIK